MRALTTALAVRMTLGWLSLTCIRCSPPEQRIIQRFVRVDRIGSRNESVQLVNFWPDISLIRKAPLKFLGAKPIRDLV